MVMTDGPVDEVDAARKWQELAPLLDRMMERVDTDGEFPVSAGSALAGDDQASNPYQVSHVARSCLATGVEHLHAVKVLVVDQGTLHPAAPWTLARVALETFSAAYWILQPAKRNERVTRALRWHAQNMRDSEKATDALGVPGHVSLKSKLAKLDVVAAGRSLDARAARAGYTSTAAVTCADRNEQDLPLGVLGPWRACSGFAHGRPWASLGLLNKVVKPTGESDVFTVRLTGSLGLTLYPTLAAMHLLERLLCLYDVRSRVHLA